MKISWYVICVIGFYNVLTSFDGYQTHTSKQHAPQMREKKGGLTFFSLENVNCITKNNDQFPYREMLTNYRKAKKS